MFSQVNNSSKKENGRNSVNSPNKVNKKTKEFKKKLPISTIPTISSKLFLSFLFLIIFALLLNGCNAFNPKNGSLEGEVHRETSYSTAPLEGALISISGSANTTTTDQKGYFLLSDIPAGKRTLTIIKEGYITLKLLNVYIEPDIINEIYFGEPIILRPKEDTILYDIAMDYLNQKDYQQALYTFIELRDTFPESTWADDAQYYIGNIYEISGLYISARDEYSRLLLYYPDSIWADDARFGIGNCYYQTSDYYHAKIQYQTVIDNYPLSDLVSFAQYRIAWCDKRLNNNDNAIQAFQQVIMLYPQSAYAAPSQYFIAEIYYGLEDYNKAINAFQETVNNYPLAVWPGEKRLIAPAAYFYIGYCYEKKEMWQAAIDNYEIIIAQYPGSTWEDGKSIVLQAQNRIDYIREHYLPPEEENSE
ncbi:MAG TPA: tetratricopeptide repeat protein [Atribacterota bacterium]|nr:tetratricopeptide repeat protein [Atribacterota bacterium]